MSTTAGPMPTPSLDDDAPMGRDATSFEWEFSSDSRSSGSYRQTQSAASTSAALAVDKYTGGQGAETRTRRAEAGDANTSIPASHQGASGAPDSTGSSPAVRFTQAHANYVRHQIDRALDAWYSASLLPAPAIVQDGLLLLEAGGQLTESQLTLLLRAALAYGRGVHTALKHQTDSERVGLIVVECLLDWNPPLHLEDRAVCAAISHPDVLRAVTVDLRHRIRESPTIGRSRASELLGELTQPTAYAPVNTGPIWRTELRRPLRGVILGLLLLAAIAFVVSQRRAANPPEMILLPAGAYTVAQTLTGDLPTVVEVASVFVDRFEVTNRAYRTCVARGVCPWPASADSLTHVAYFTNPAHADSPVIHVTQAAASAYCAWQGKRLPTAAEWTVAGGGAAATGQINRFPWGVQFDLQRANSTETSRGDTVPVGSFRPGGDSPMGASDMAGNVAEWTSTSRGEGAVMIKGGSFADDRSALQVTSEQWHSADESAPWLGFRCARSGPSTR